MSAPKKTTRYRVTFTETVTYVVTFDSEVGLVEATDPTSEADWFDAMDKARPDWFQKPDSIEVTDRDLDDIEEVTA